MSRRNARAERDALLAARRESLAVLLSRAERGVLTRPEAALLRATIDAEISEGDRARREAGGQQAAVRREQQRVAAAEAAIVEAEQRAEAAEQALADHRYRDHLAEELLDRPELLAVDQPADLDRLLDHVAEQLNPTAQQ